MSRLSSTTRSLRRAHKTPPQRTRHISSATCPNPLPATFMRGGTSKGIFLNRRHLPRDERDWAPIFRGIMGSPDERYGRQLNGMGGGVSSLSKVCVVDRPCGARREAGVDAVYTFVQVGIRDDTVDMSGNCGNLSSVVGVFAMDEGICQPRLTSTPSSNHALATTTLFNTNTSKLCSTTFPVSLPTHGAPTPLLDLPQVQIAGVPGLASRIDLDFLSPSGARTGSLLPTTRPSDTLHLPSPHPHTPVRASLVDATNPTVFVRSADLGLAPSTPYNPDTHAILEALRQAGATMMGLDPAHQAQPKIAVLSPSAERGVDIVVRALSMGVLHKAVPMTVGLCLGVAANVPGTIPWEIVREARADGGLEGMVRIEHPSGVVDVGVQFEGAEVKAAKVVRTGRRLMKGLVWW
jgi:2-methylaconitate cis-trans-isomerase PrpF